MKHILAYCCLTRAGQAAAIVGLLLGLQCAAQAQVAASDTLAQTIFYTEVEQAPQLPKANRKQTHEEAVTRAILFACRYPAEAFRHRVQGTVVVGFTVNPEGKVRDVRIEESLHPDLDEATVAAVKTLPLFRPGKQHGRVVSVRYRLPIRWALR